MKNVPSTRRHAALSRRRITVVLLLTAGLSPHAGAYAMSEPPLDWWQQQTLTAFIPGTGGGSPFARSGEAAAEWEAVRRTADGVHRRASAVAADLPVPRAASEAVEVGGNATALNRAVAVGFRTFALTDATAVGRGARADVEGVAIGSSAEAGNYSVAMGYGAKASAEFNVAIGHGARAAESRATAVGRDAMATALGSIALGNASRASVRNAIALGSGALSEHEDAIVLGADSRSSGSHQVSVGTNENQRRIVHVADGEVKQGSTEVVTGNQLFRTEQRVDEARHEALMASRHAEVARRDAGMALEKADHVGGLIGDSTPAGAVHLGRGNSGTLLDIANGSGARRTIQNVADGALSERSTDAVTGQQLYRTNRELSTQGGYVAEHRVQLEQLRTDFAGFDRDLGGMVRFNEDMSVVDVGGARITGVRDGDASSARSIDAINGAQLFATNQRIDALATNDRFLAIGVRGEERPAEAGQYGLALGKSAVASLGGDVEGAVAIGYGAEALATNAVALGRGSYVVAGATDGFALGTRSSVAGEGGIAIGMSSQVDAGATNSVAIGRYSRADSDLTVAFGNDAVRRRLVSVARGRGEHDAATIGQLDDALAALGGGARMNGGNVVAPAYTVQGNEHRTVGEALRALDGAVVNGSSRLGGVEAQLQAVFQQSPALRSDGQLQLQLAGANGMVLGNIADGRVAAGSRDAVNGGQLHAVRQQLDGRIDGLQQRMAVDSLQARTDPSDAAEPSAAAATANEQARDGAQSEPPAEVGRPDTAAAAEAGPKPTPPAQHRSAASSPPVDARQLEQLQERVNAYTDRAVAGVEQRMQRMDRRLNRMVAMSSAQSAMAMNTAGLQTYNRLGAGIGHADGESALAVGYQRVLNERGSSTLSLHGAFTQSGERGVGLGVGVGW